MRKKGEIFANNYTTEKLLIMFCGKSKKINWVGGGGVA